MEVAISHTLGRAEAKRRIEAGLPKLAAHIPGGGKLASEWTSDSSLALTITALGSAIPVALEVLDDKVIGSVEVPLFLQAMQGQIAEFVKTSATKMLSSS